MVSRKVELRREMKQVLQALDERWLQAASEQVCTNLFKLIEKDLSKRFEHILAWTSFFPGEVDLSTFLMREMEARKVYLPRCLEDRSMDFISISQDWLSQVETGPSGVPEPKHSVVALYDSSDSLITENTLVLVPGLAFDRDGNRLGRGAGYYDRFLAKPALKSAIKVGICWSLQMVELVPTEEHEMAVDWVCHEDGYVKTAFTYTEDFE